MVGRRVLAPLIQVQILVPQPIDFNGLWILHNPFLFVKSFLCHFCATFSKTYYPKLIKIFEDSFGLQMHVPKVQMLSGLACIRLATRNIF